MSESIRRRVRHRAGTKPPLPADSTRTILRRRRCSEPPTRRHGRRPGSGGTWRTALMAGCLLLAGGPAWAVAEHYHEEVATFMRQTRAHLEWVGVHAPAAASSKPLPQGTSPAGRGGSSTVAGTFASLWGGASGSPRAVPVAAVPARPFVRASAVAPSVPAFAPLAPEGMHPPANREDRGHSRIAAARANANPASATTVNTVDFTVDAGNGNSPYALNTGDSVTVSDIFTVGSNSTGVVNQNGGTVTGQPSGTGAGAIEVGDLMGSTGTYNLQSGSVNVASLQLGGSAPTYKAGNGGGNGTFLQSGGSVVVSGGLVVGYDLGSVSSSYSLSAGSLSSNYTIVGGYGKGTFTLSGAGTQTTGDLVLDAYGATGSGTYNLDGGTLTANDVKQGSTGTATFNFNGGTLRAGQSDNPGAATGATTFMTGLSAANVQAGGAIIDTNGFSVTIAQPLLHDPSLGDTADGGLTKNGTGTLTLAGNSTYLGDSVVMAGALLVNNVPVNAGDSGTGSGTVFVGPGGKLGGTGAIGGNVAVGVTGGFSPTPLAAPRPRDVVNSAVLAPGVDGVGTLTINGTLSLSSNAVLAITLGSTPAANLVRAGSASLAGSLELTLGTGVTLAVGERFFVLELMDGTTQVTGTFENAGANGTFVDDQGDTYAIDYTDNTAAGAGFDAVSLTVVSLVPEPGTWAMFGLGLAGMGIALARRRVRG